MKKIFGGLIVWFTVSCFAAVVTHISLHESWISSFKNSFMVTTLTTIAIILVSTGVFLITDD